MQGSSSLCRLSSNSSFTSPKCCSSADGVQHLGHALSPRPLFVGGHLCLYNQDEPEKEVQLVCSYLFPPIGNGSSKFEQKWGEETCPSFKSLGWSI